MSTALTAKQQRFIGEFQIDYNATQAALRSGYSKRTARVIGGENLLKPAIKKALCNARRAMSEKTRLTVEWVETRLMRVVEDCLAPQPIVDRDGHATGRFCFDSAGALRGLELLCRRLRLFSSEEPEPGEPEQPLFLNLPPQMMLVWAARIRAQRERGANPVPLDVLPYSDLVGATPAPLGVAVMAEPQRETQPVNDMAVGDEASRNGVLPSIDTSTGSAPPLKTDRARLLARLLTPSDHPPRPCDHCGVLFRPQMTERHCCYACVCRDRGKSHRLQHTADCRRVSPQP